MKLEIAIVGAGPIERPLIESAAAERGITIITNEPEPIPFTNPYKGLWLDYPMTPTTIKRGSNFTKPKKKRK
jgi:hypothetical protein